MNTTQLIDAYLDREGMKWEDISYVTKRRLVEKFNKVAEELGEAQAEGRTYEVQRYDAESGIYYVFDEDTGEVLYMSRESIFEGRAHDINYPDPADPRNARDLEELYKLCSDKFDNDSAPVQENGYLLWKLVSGDTLSVTAERLLRGILPKVQRRNLYMTNVIELRKLAGLDTAKNLSRYISELTEKGFLRVAGKRMRKRRDRLIEINPAYVFRGNVNIRKDYIQRWMEERTQELHTPPQLEPIPLPEPPRILKTLGAIIHYIRNPLRIGTLSSSSAAEDVIG